MLESINTLLLTLSLSRDSDQADSLLPKEFKFYSHNTPWIYGNCQPARRIQIAELWSCCGKHLTATVACLFEQSGGSTTIDNIA